jgi:uncharacterized lipoprotein YddW (UPF0748 family)
MISPVLRRRELLAAGSAAAALAACSNLAPEAQAPALLPAPELLDSVPAAPREFRAAWVATVANIDWPSKPGLGAEQQQAEARALLDQAQSLKLNAIVLQVRPCADALYESSLEPWSEYLTGVQGQHPGYDPLALWIREAHARGLELHAWLNPFRARHGGSARSGPAASHVSQMRPQWVKRYGDLLWMDPGEPGAAAHTLAVAAELIERYELDGLHIDDYFYPYPQPDGRGGELDFPDEPSWQRYQQSGGTLARADWRRRNVDELVQRLHALVRGQTRKPWLRLGISPFGLPRPGLRPPGIQGFSQYDKLYADVERWLAEGWLDYLAPQLYWPRAQAAQAFVPLLQAWRGLNPKARHIWPGLFTSRITDKSDSWPAEEIEGQIAALRELAPGSGHLHFSMVALAQNRRGIADLLRARSYAEPALVPATPWLAAAPPAAPQPDVAIEGQVLRLRLRERAAGTRHALWLRRSGRWDFAGALPDELQTERAGLEAIAVAALDRAGNEGARTAWRLALA